MNRVRKARLTEIQTKVSQLNPNTRLSSYITDIMSENMELQEQNIRKEMMNEQINRENMILKHKNNRLKKEIEDLKKYMTSR